MGANPQPDQMSGSICYPEDTIIAAFLHDAAEDAGVSTDEITARYGPRVAAAVDALSKTWRGHRRAHDRVVDAIEADPIASIVKGADRLHNLSTMVDAFSDDKMREYLSETTDWVLPMLHRARRIHVEQEAAYENVKLGLNTQLRIYAALLQRSGSSQPDLSPSGKQTLGG